MQWFSPLPFLLVVLGFVGLRTAVAQGVPPGTQVSDLLYTTPSCAVRWLPLPLKTPPPPLPGCLANRNIEAQRGCVVRELMGAHCPLLDITALADCLCPNTALLAKISTCVQQSCNHSDAISTCRYPRAEVENN